MKCPSERAILEDWQRSRRGEPMLYASHVADCERCDAVIKRLDTLRDVLSHANGPSKTGHLDAGTRLAYVERSLSAEESVQVDQHVACCSECRHDVMELLLAGQETGRDRLPVAWWTSLARNGGLALAGAAVAVAFLLVVPMLPNQQTHNAVAVYGTKGAVGRDAAAALKAVNPSDADLDFAIAVWRKALEMNPDDKLAAARLAELESRRNRSLDHRRE